LRLSAIESLSKRLKPFVHVHSPPLVNVEDMLY
jgi:hypothetical protein